MMLERAHLLAWEQSGIGGQLFQLARASVVSRLPSPATTSELVLLPCIHEYASTVLLAHIRVRRPRGHEAVRDAEDMIAALLAEPLLPVLLSSARRIVTRERAAMLAVLCPEDASWAVAFCLVLMMVCYPNACLCL